LFFFGFFSLGFSAFFSASDFFFFFGTLFFLDEEGV